MSVCVTVDEYKKRVIIQILNIATRRVDLRLDYMAAEAHQLPRGYIPLATFFAQAEYLEARCRCIIALYRCMTFFPPPPPLDEHSRPPATPRGMKDRWTCSREKESATLVLMMGAFAYRAHLSSNDVASLNIPIHNEFLLVVNHSVSSNERNL